MEGSFITGHDVEWFFGVIQIVNVHYRTDSDPPVETVGTVPPTHDGALIFDADMPPMLRDMHGADRFFVRIIDFSLRHEARFDLAGTDKIVAAVFAACGWSVELGLGEGDVFGTDATGETADAHVATVDELINDLDLGVSRK